LIVTVPLAGFIDQIYLNETDQRVVIEQRITQFAEVIGGEVDNWVNKNTLNSTFNLDNGSVETVEHDDKARVFVTRSMGLGWR